ncbi:MAG: hypothetical protein AAFY07_03865 [Pseudomonadota bacterium]
MSGAFPDQRDQSGPLFEPAMSQQLTISSLFSALSLVLLVLFARTGAPMDDFSASGGAMAVEIHAIADLQP